MPNDNMISVKTFCIHHHVDLAFIESLQHFGLIETVVIEEDSFIPEEKLTEVEKLIRLHQELDLNFEGLDVISHMLEKMKAMQSEIMTLRERLGLYE
ncbi:MAG TPA: chaperone modulator CbpM [Ferruginibacter sp.]|nr:chaperone modulator CbpM [Ferruginibacter sp.]